MPHSFIPASFECTAPDASNAAAHVYILVREDKGCCDQLLCDASGQLRLLDQDQFERYKTQLGPTKLTEILGKGGDNQAYWVVVVDNTSVLRDDQWHPLRGQLYILSAEQFNLAGRAVQIAQWFFEHQFCGSCGAATQRDNQDRALVCSRCDRRFYPRIAPCMIALVTRGKQLLLARHVRANRPVYSALAGFVEVGETVEQAVRREVLEEVGLEVGALEYIASQPWPFPGQLMLGFLAEYQSGEPQPDPREILDVRWFSYDQLPETPRPGSIANQLIRLFVDRCQRAELANNIVQKTSS